MYLQYSDGDSQKGFKGIAKEVLHILRLIAGLCSRGARLPQATNFCL